MAAISNSAILNSTILDSAILHKKTWLIHSHWTWWWQPSWILPCWIQTLLSWIQTPCYLFQIHSKTLSLHSCSHLYSTLLKLAILDSAILVFPLKLTHTCQDWFPPFAQKNFTYSFWLNLKMAAILKSAILDSANLHKKLYSFIQTQLDDDSHLEFCHVGFRHCHLVFRHLVIFFQIHSKTLSLHSDSDSNYFILTESYSVSLKLMMAAILNPDILNSTILDSAILVFPLKLTHTCQDWFQPFAQKTFIHSFWLNLIIAAILNSVRLNSDTAILDSDTLLSSLRLTQKHSHSTLTMTQTNSIWLKLFHSQLTWWW